MSCGIEYEGTVIDTSNINGMRKRATEPTLQACQNLCDSIPACVALNYEGTNCTLLSSVTGTSYVPGAVAGSQVPSSSPDNPVCPGWAGQAYTDSAKTVYGIGCFMDYAGNDIGTPISESSFVNCLPYCDSMSGCAGVEFNVAYSLCYLKSSFSGLQTSNTSVIYGMKNRAVSGGNGGVDTVTPTITPSITSTICKYSFFGLGILN